VVRERVIKFGGQISTLEMFGVPAIIVGT